MSTNADGTEIFSSKNEFNTNSQSSIHLGQREVKGRSALVPKKAVCVPSGATSQAEKQHRSAVCVPSGATQPVAPVGELFCKHLRVIDELVSLITKLEY